VSLADQRGQVLGEAIVGLAHAGLHARLDVPVAVLGRLVLLRAIDESNYICVLFIIDFWNLGGGSIDLIVGAFGYYQND